jgi:hypothetical protein
MSTKKRLTRISCTVPEDVVAAADRIAEAEQRSRSWVISEAVRRYAGGAHPAPRPVREASSPAYAAEAIAEGREGQLRRNLGLSPEERLAEAEELMAFAKGVHPRRRRAQIIGFETLEDFAAWKAEERARR